ncbi:olfactory receptor 6B2-like [Xenopus laevis]|uniref:Olfactory receptor n=1 Tax=Xenopus laevis TaxID=8355 RepID=A0A8J1LM28_XENLA|nr:olfactory receptor 6B2-like [Xenopus laevis]
MQGFHNLTRRLDTSQQSPSPVVAPPVAVPVGSPVVMGNVHKSHEPKISFPEKFNGDRSKFFVFQEACKLYLSFFPQSFPTGEEKVMGGKNQTFIQQILLLGFQVPNSFRIPVFLLVIVLYSVTLTANVTIVSLVSSNSSLHHPMFFFLSHLSLCDIILMTTDIVPVMLHGILEGGVTMGTSACITQLLFHGSALTSECLILAVMSYDRYLAICNPLHYVTIMCINLQLYLVSFCWFLSFTISIVPVIFISKLDLCASHTINHFFCDFAPLLQLSCSDTSLVELVDTVLAVPLSLFPVLFIIITYICIFNAILRIPTTTGRHKTFSTCSSHLTIVTMFFGTLIAVYVVPSNENSLVSKKIISLLYTVATPLLNPLIYSLQNKKIRTAFQKYLQCMVL